MTKKDFLEIFVETNPPRGGHVPGLTMWSRYLIANGQIIAECGTDRNVILRPSRRGYAVRKLKELAANITLADSEKLAEWDKELKCDRDKRDAEATVSQIIRDVSKSVAEGQAVLRVRRTCRVARKNARALMKELNNYVTNSDDIKKSIQQVLLDDLPIHISGTFRTEEIHSTASYNELIRELYTMASMGGHCVLAGIMLENILKGERDED